MFILQGKDKRMRARRDVWMAPRVLHADQTQVRLVIFHSALFYTMGLAIVEKLDLIVNPYPNCPCPPLFCFPAVVSMILLKLESDDLASAQRRPVASHLTQSKSQSPWCDLQGCRWHGAPHYPSDFFLLVPPLFFMPSLFQEHARHVPISKPCCSLSRNLSPTFPLPRPQIPVPSFFISLQFFLKVTSQWCHSWLPHLKLQFSPHLVFFSLALTSI